jgi:archaellum component FlaC
MLERQVFLDQLKMKIEELENNISELETKSRLVGEPQKSKLMDKLVQFEKALTDIRENYQKVQEIKTDAWKDLKNHIDNKIVDMKNEIKSIEIPNA